MPGPPAKQARIDPAQAANVIVQFQTADGEDTGAHTVASRRSWGKRRPLLRPWMRSQAHSSTYHTT